MKQRIRRIPTAKFIFREDFDNAYGEHLVYITNSVERKTAKTDAAVWLDKCDWNDSRQCVRATHPRHNQLNGIIQARRNEIDTRLVDLDPKIPLTIELLRKIVKGESIDDADECNCDFVDFALEVMVERQENLPVMFFFVHNADFMAKVERSQAGFKMIPRTVVG